MDHHLLRLVGYPSVGDGASGVWGGAMGFYLGRHASFGYRIHNGLVMVDGWMMIRMVTLIRHRRK